MAIDPEHLDRLREVLDARPAITEKKMFGGVFFMLSGNMLCGLAKHGFMFRVGEEQADVALDMPGASQAVTNRPMVGFVNVEADIAVAEGLERWVDMATAYVGALPAKD